MQNENRSGHGAQIAAKVLLELAQQALLAVN